MIPLTDEVETVALLERACVPPAEVLYEDQDVLAVDKWPEEPPVPRHDGPLPAAHTAPARPHLVLFLADDHGQEFAGCYGNRVIRTPHLDALARQGRRFTRVFAASPTCAPSRAVLYTGLYPARNGAMGNHTTCRPDIRALPTYLKALGYRVVLANKLHVAPPSVFDFELLKATLPL